MSDETPDEEPHGPSLVTNPNLPFGPLGASGPTLVSHLRMKLRPAPLLKDVTLIDSPQRMRRFLLTVALCATAMVTLCVVDYLGVHDFEFINHLDTIEGLDIANLEQKVVRMRGTGIFQDPNDLAIRFEMGMLLFNELGRNS